jgi:hypothetical protein
VLEQVGGGVVVPALAVTPVFSLSSLMAAASSRALRVVPSVAMAVPLMVSEPLAMPEAATPRPSAVPVSCRRCRR